MSTDPSSRPPQPANDTTPLLSMAARNGFTQCPEGSGHLPNKTSSTPGSTCPMRPFVPPGPSDLRSPCPGLNTLANHGYINHDGKNLTISALVEAIHSVYHLTKPLAFLMTITGVLFCGNGRTVDLHQLAKHNAIEHDASLSRPDTQPPSKFAPIDADPEIVDQLMRISPENFLVLKDIATHRVNRESQAVGGPLDFIHAEIARAEFSLLLQVFGNDNMEVDKDLLRNWFVEGRLPDSWKAPEKTIGILTSVALTRRIAAAVKAIRNSKEE